MWILLNYFFCNLCSLIIEAPYYGNRSAATLFQRLVTWLGNVRDSIKHHVCTFWNILESLKLGLAIRIRNSSNFFCYIWTQNPKLQFKLRIWIVKFYDFCSTCKIILNVAGKTKKVFYYLLTASKMMGSIQSFIFYFSCLFKVRLG